MEVEVIISTILWALALAIGVTGAILLYLEIEVFGTNTPILILFIGMIFIAIAGLNLVDRTWLNYRYTIIPIKISLKHASCCNIVLYCLYYS